MRIYKPNLPVKCDVLGCGHISKTWKDALFHVLEHERELDRKPQTGTTSLRATIPEGIIAFLDLKAGDKLEWNMDMIEGERVSIVRRVKIGYERKRRR